VPRAELQPLQHITMFVRQDLPPSANRTICSIVADENVFSLDGVIITQHIGHGSPTFESRRFIIVLL
jgi:hypothetical protein